MPAEPKEPAQRRRRNKPEQWTVLPEGGCTLDPPAWPSDILARPTKQETALWSRLWSRPIAWWWHEQELEPATIARYVRTFRRAVTRPDMKLDPTVSRMEKALGLTPESMKSLRLVVGEWEDPLEEGPRAEPYRNLRVIDGAG